MLLIRTLLFTILFVLGGLFFSITALVFLMPFPVRFIVAYNKAWLKASLWMMRYVLGLDHKVIGLENLPPPPFIIASKHQSALETLIFPTILTHPYLIVKKELVFIPFWGWMLKKYGAGLLDRSHPKKSLKQLLHIGSKCKEEGRELLVFPEGTRVGPGETIPYKAGITMLYQHMQVPVVPVAVNTGLFWGRRSFIKKPGCAVMRILPPIEPGLPKKEFLEKLTAAIEGASQNLLESKYT